MGKKKNCNPLTSFLCQCTLKNPDLDRFLSCVYKSLNQVNNTLKSGNKSRCKGSYGNKHKR